MWHGSKERLRVALVGPGPAAQDFVGALHASRDAQLVAAVGREPGAGGLRWPALPRGVAKVPELAALRPYRVDAAVVCTPDLPDGRIARGALRYGLHVLGAEPLTGGLADATRLFSEAARAARHIASAVPQRFMFPTVWQAVERERIGPVSSVTLHFRSVRRVPADRRDLARAASGALDHLLSVGLPSTLGFLSSPVAVEGLRNQPRAGAFADGYAGVSVYGHRENTVLVLTYGYGDHWMDPRAEDECELTVAGGRGTVMARDVTGRTPEEAATERWRPRHWQRGDVTRPLAERPASELLAPSRTVPDCRAAALAAFVADVRAGGAATQRVVESELRLCRVAEAVRQSVAADGARVEL